MVGYGGAYEEKQRPQTMQKNKKKHFGFRWMMGPMVLK
jgi:hypothetical protein